MLFIFDMGGVVSGNVQTIPAMAGRLCLTVPEFFRLCGVPGGPPPASSYDFGLLAEIQAGRINSDAFWKGFRRNAEEILPPGHPGGGTIPVTTRAENLWKTCFHPEPIGGTLELIGKLRRNGHRVVCGTNTLDAHYAAHRQFGDYRVFDAVYASHFMGVIKPDPAFWERILAEEGAVPGNTVFIDDNPQNVDAARRIGIRSILFTSPEQLERDLRPAFLGDAVPAGC
jgi:haloacid dehalogenase superfamily, subfamily IA, variant 3 with third motif having DD or ED